MVQGKARQLTYKKYPSTAMLQCFESAARHLSFTLAAKEMYMTQGAISKKIAQLETMLNLSLFKRTPQGLGLTEAGSRYYTDVLSILSSIEIATTSLMSESDNVETIRVMTPSCFGERYFVPLICEYSALNPLINFEVINVESDFSHIEKEFDVGIMYGSGAWEGVDATKLIDESCIPVCSPAYLKDNPEITDSVKQGKLLHVNSRLGAWYEFFKQQDVSYEGLFIGNKFDSYSLCIEAACCGLGVALLPKLLISEELDAGRLVNPCDYEMKSFSSYFIVTQSTRRTNQVHRNFVEWLKNKYAHSEME